MAGWLSDFYREVRPNARWDFIKWGVKLIVLGVLFLASWYTSQHTALGGVPPLLIGIAVFAVFAFIFAAVSFGVSKWRTKENGQSQDAPGQSDVEKALIKCRARLAEIERELTKSVERYDDTEWLRNIASYQKTFIERYLRIGGSITDHSLVEEPLFIDFRFSFESASIYTLTATGLSGSIRIGNRRLGNVTPNNYPPRIESNELQDLALGQTGYLTITQPLTRADAIFILNGSAEFMFDGLFVELSTTPSIQRPIKLSPHDSINNKELRNKYPKLEIKFKRAVYLYIPDRREPDYPELINCGITLDVTLGNLRNTQIEIDSVQVSLVNINQPTFRLQPDAGEICERRFIDGNGVCQITGDKLKNLANFPLSIIGRGRLSGCFQFTLEGVPLGTVKAKDTSASLVLTDKYGEHHVGNHDLDHFV